MKTKLKIDEWNGMRVFVKKDFTYDVDSDMFKITYFKSDDEYKITFNNTYSIAINGCMFSLEQNSIPFFYEHFYTLKEYRKEKLNKINNK